MTFRHRAGVSPHTSPFGFAQTCVFGKQSLGPFLCGPPLLPKYNVHKGGRAFSRSYGTILPSSLTRVRSRALESSSYLPVSVCGTGITLLPSGFSRQCGYGNFPTPSLFRSPSRLGVLTGLLTPAHPRAWTYIPKVRSLFLLRPRVGQTLHDGTGIFTCCPSPAPFGLGLGPDLPWVDEPCPGNLRFPASRILTCFLATNTGILTRMRSTALSSFCFNAHAALPYQLKIPQLRYRA